MSGGPIPIDVHRAVNQQLVAPGLSDNGWATFSFVESPKSMPSGRHVTILGSTDALLHTIVHGLGWNGPVVLRWVTDAVQLLRSGDVETARLCMLSERFSIAPVVHDALRYVDDIAGGLVDPAVFAELSSVPSSRLGDLRLRAFHERPEHEGEPPPLGFTVSRFLQRTKGDRSVRSLGRLPEVLRDQFEADGWIQLSRRMAGAALMRMGQCLSGP
jgi:hypothetical protein